MARVEIEATSVWDRLLKELGAGALGLGPGGLIGFEAHVVTVKESERFSSTAAAWRWKPAGQLLERLRVRKVPGEIAAIRSAAELAAEAVDEELAPVGLGHADLP